MLYKYIHIKHKQITPKQNKKQLTNTYVCKTLKRQNTAVFNTNKQITTAS